MLLVPTGEPFTFHWYTGVVPPLVGVAVKVTLVPVQTSDAGDATMLTLVGKSGLTAMVMVLEVAGDPVRQGVALEVITHFTVCPLVGIKV